MDQGLVAETYLVLCGVDVDIHLFRGQGNVQQDYGIAALFQE
jgi:hypothetical protein